jgi:hypothetical protein
MSVHENDVQIGSADTDQKRARLKAARAELHEMYITSMAIAHGGDPTSHLEAIGPTVRSLQAEINALEAELARRDKSDR